MQQVVDQGAEARLAEPFDDGRREPQLVRPQADAVGQDAPHGLAQNVLGHPPPHLPLRTQREQVLDQPVIEQRQPRFDGEGHGVAVLFAQQLRQRERHPVGQGLVQVEAAVHAVRHVALGGHPTGEGGGQGNLQIPPPQHRLDTRRRDEQRRGQERVRHHPMVPHDADGLGRRRPGPARQQVLQHQVPHEEVVPGHEFVAALSVQEDFDPPRVGQPHDLPLGEVARRSEGFLLVIDDALQILEQPLQRRSGRVAAHAGQADHVGHVARLIERGVRKHDAERLVAARIDVGQVVHRADDAGRVEPTREARADLDVGPRQPQTDGVEEEVAEPSGRFAFVADLARPAEGNRVPSAARETPLTQVERRALARQQRRDAVEERVVGVVVAVERQVIVDGQRVGPAGNVGPLENRLDLAREDESVARVPKVQRLDAEPVPRQKQRALRLIVDGEGEHAVETLQAPLAPLLVRLQNDLGVGAGAKRVTEAAEVGGQFKVVIDLTVVDNLQPAVGRGHRLAPGRRQVDDRQPTVTQPDTLVGEHAGIVGTAMRLDGHHAGPQIRVRPVEAADAAHGSTVPLAYPVPVSRGTRDRGAASRPRVALRRSWQGGRPRTRRAFRPPPTVSPAAPQCR